MYSINGTLTLIGTKADVVKAKLLSVVGNGKSRDTEKNDNSSLTLQDEENLHIVGDNIIPLGGTTATPDESRLKELESKMEKFAEIISAKVDALPSDIDIIRNENRHHSDDLFTGLQAEILKLKNENDELRERNTNLSYIMTDLNTKLKDVENEKESLITVIKLLQSEYRNTKTSSHIIIEEDEENRNDTNCNQTRQPESIVQEQHANNR